MVWLIAVKIVGLLLVFDPWAIQSSDLPKTIFSRVVAWLMAGLLIALLLRHGFAVIPRSPVHFAVVALLAANVLSAIFAENILLAQYGDFPRFLGMGFVADMAVLYLAVAVALRTTHDWGVLAGATLGSFLVMAAYAWVQAAGLDPIAWTDDPVSRPFSTLGGPDQYGQVLSMFIGATLGLLLLSRRRLCGLAGAACLITALVTAAVVATRGTLVGLGAALLTTVVLVIVSRGRRAALVFSAVAATAILAGLLFLPSSPLGTRAAATLADRGGLGRLALYDVSLTAWRERPLFGYGVDNFGPAFVANRAPAHYSVLSSGLRETSAHSWVLQAGVTTGAFGLVTLVGVIAVSVVALLRGLRTTPALSGTLLVASAAYWAHAGVAAGAVGVDWFPWFTSGAAVALSPTRAVQWNKAAALGRHAVIVSSVTIVALATAGAFLPSVSSVMASHEAWEARDAVRERQGFRAISEASAATRHEPLRADHWNWLGLAYDIHARWEDGAHAFARAADLAPHEIQYRVNEARAYARLALERRSAEDFDRSRAALATARAADPHHPLAYQVQAEVELAAGRPEAALGQALVAYGLEPRGDLLALVRQGVVAASPSSTPLLMITEALKTRETAALHVVAGELALEAGARARARAHATRAIELEPGLEPARRLLDAARP